MAYTTINKSTAQFDINLYQANGSGKTISGISFQPDFIIEYAHHVGDYYKEKGYENLSVFADSHVALNGRKSQRFIDPSINLYQQKRSLKNYEWVLPFKDEIKGF